jgi:Rrf2 family transcriptional regulator, iron-sulfur cluster assembly transcription factor
MITISKKVEYSIILISYLIKHEGETVSLSDVSKKLILPYRFLGQLAGALKNGGLIDSREGKKGGYSLNKSWSKKSLYDLLEILGENKHIVKCLAGDAVCAREANCRLRGVWDKMEKSFTKELKLIKLSDL